MIYAESETIELKSEIAGDICKEIIAFANTQGGTIYIGIQDDGTITGIQNADEAMRKLNNMIRDSIKPDITMLIHYEVQTVEEKQVLSVTVQKGSNRPYYLASKGLKPAGVYVRNGTASDPSTNTAIRKMIKETDGDSFEDMRSLEQNLTFEATQKEFEKCGVPFDKSKMKSMGMVSIDDIYSNVGLLLSDQCANTIKAAAFAGTDQREFQDRREFSGSLFQQMEELYAYLELRNQTKATFQGLYRKDIRDYPEEAIREALMNAIVHRDYSYSASTLVSIYEDRIEFVSIGGLPEGVEADDIMLGLSVCRNQKLAAIFYRLKLIEAYGTGRPKIIRAYEDSGYSPKIEVTSNAFKITLPNRNFGERKGQPNKDPEDKILEYLDTHGTLVRSDVDTLLEVSQSTSSRILRNMEMEGLIFKEGRGRRTKYRKL